MSSELQKLPTCSPVEQSFVYVCALALILELGRSELGWLGRAKNNGLRERGGEEAGRIIVEEAGKYDPPGSTHCRYVHKCTETHIHKTQTQKVKCDLAGSSTVRCTPRYKKLCWIRCALHERVLQPAMCASMSEDCRFVHFAEFLFRASHHFSPPLSHPPVRDGSGACPGAVW